MLWLISNYEPDCLYAVILTDEHLRSGVVKDLVKLLPWYKRTAQMESILARHLVSIIRSGFERSYLIKQLGSLDIPAEAAGDFLRTFEERGACHFGEPRYLYSQVVNTAKYTKGVVVQGRYLESKVVISETLSQCLQLLKGGMLKEKYLQALEEYLGSYEYAEKACRTLAQLGLVLSSDSSQPTTIDYGPQRWNLDIVSDGKLLDAEAWEQRLNFLQESFKAFYFQSRYLFSDAPLQLWGDFGIVALEDSNEYFWHLSFKLQKFYNQIPVNLILSASFPQIDWEQFRLRLPTLFKWNLTADLRLDGEQVVEELIQYVSNQGLSKDVVITLLVGRNLPSNIVLLSERANLKLYSSDCTETSIKLPFPINLSHANRQSLKPHHGRDGCGALLSLHIDGQGRVKSCPLEGGLHLGQLEDGARQIERKRQDLKIKYMGACHFGTNPAIAGEAGDTDGLVRTSGDTVAGQWTARKFICP
jgi:hypothetical protein